MAEEFTSRKKKQKKLLEAAFFRHRNLFILSTGIVTGILASPILIPIGIIVYGIVCYLDLQSEEFVKKVLYPEANGVKPGAEKPPLANTSPLQLIVLLPSGLSTPMPVTRPRSSVTIAVAAVSKRTGMPLDLTI